MFNDANRQKKCYENAIALVKILMAYHGFTTKQIKRHYDWTKKDCPTWLRSGKFGYTWDWFVQSCGGTVTPNIQASKTQVQPKAKYPNGTYKKKGRVTASALNVRKGRPGTKEYNTILKVLPKGTVVEIGYILNMWGSVYIPGANPGYLSMEYIEWV